MSPLRRRSRETILARLDRAVIEQRRISAVLERAAVDQDKVNNDIDDVRRDLRSRAMKGRDDDE